MGPSNRRCCCCIGSTAVSVAWRDEGEYEKDKIRSRGGYLLQKQQPSSPAAAAAAAAGAAGAGASASMSSNSNNVEGDASAAVEIVINSRGGSLTAGLALYDILSLLSPLLPVKTLAVGTAGHIASLLLAAGSKGKRKATKNTKIFCCESACTAQGSADELIQQTASVEGQEKLFEFLLSKHTDTPQGEVAEWRRQCRVFTAQEAKEKGIIDAVIPEGN